MAGCNDSELPEQEQQIAPPEQTQQTVPTDKQDTLNPMSEDTSDDEWQKTWDARLAAFEQVLGKSEDTIVTAPVPIYLGGDADVLIFKNHVDGVAYVTAGLIGDGSQKQTDLGEYELMMCFREENEWAPSLLSRLAPYTFQRALKSGETMDIAPAMPENSTISSLLFVSYQELTVNEADAGILLCIGITKSEFAECQKNGPSSMIAKLKESGVFPFTDPERDSVIE